MNQLSGSTIDAAIKLDATCSEDAVELENKYLAHHFGVQDRDWIKRGQSLISDRGYFFDCIAIEIRGKIEHIFFDITIAIEMQMDDELD